MSAAFGIIADSGVVAALTAVRSAWSSQLSFLRETQIAHCLEFAGTRGDYGMRGFFFAFQEDC